MYLLLSNKAPLATLGMLVLQWSLCGSVAGTNDDDVVKDPVHPYCGRCSRDFTTKLEITKNESLPLLPTVKVVAWVLQRIQM